MVGDFLYGSIRTYSAFVSLSVLVGVLVIAFAAWRTGLSVWRIVLLALGIALTALVGAKLWGLVEENSFARLAWVNLVSGFRYPGALAGVLVGLVVWRRVLFPQVSVAALGDLIAPAMGFAEAVGRVGCFLSGCCFGRVSTLPWAICFPRNSPAYRFQGLHGLLSGDPARSLPVHPLQLYFLGLALGLGILCLRLQRHQRYDGQVLLVFVAVHEWGKFLLEFLRFPAAPDATVYLHAAALVAALFATAVLLHRRDTARLPAERVRLELGAP